MSHTQTPQLKAKTEEKIRKDKREKNRLRQLKLNKKHHKSAKLYEDYSYLELFK